MASGKADNRKYLFPVQDQKDCGSCTAFGVTRGLEGNFKLRDGTAVKLSERCQFFRSGGTCDNGNTMAKALANALRGIASEEFCPYQTNGRCDGANCKVDWYKAAKKASNYIVLNDEEEMKEALDQGHNLVSTMYVFESFLHYVSGVWHPLEQDNLLGGHCIAICGYDDAKGAWILSNSWGTGWGNDPQLEPGYAWVKYGEAKIDTEMYQLVPDGTVDPDPPTPSPCKIGNSFARLFNLIPLLFGRKGRFYYLNP